MIQISWTQSDTFTWIDLVPFFGPLFGVLIPLVIGYWFYRFQKEVDREEQMHSEKREAYRTCIQSLILMSGEAVKVHSGAKEDWDRSISQSALGSLALVKLYADDQINELGLSVFGQLVDGFDANDKDQPTLGELVTAMKKDLNCKNKTKKSNSVKGAIS